MDPNQLSSPPVYNQPINPPQDTSVFSTGDQDEDALQTVRKAYDDARQNQDSYFQLVKQLYQLWRFYKSADSSVRVFNPIGFALTIGLLSKMFVKTPKILLSADDGGWKWLAKILQNYLEKQFSNPYAEEPMEEEFVSFITEMLVTGTAVAKVCWLTKYITQFKESPAPMTDPATGQPIIDPMTGLPKMEITRQPVRVKAYDDPVFEHIPIEHFYLQPGAKTISQSKYCIFEKFVDEDYLRDLTEIIDPITNKPIYQNIQQAIDDHTTAPGTADPAGVTQARHGKAPGSTHQEFKNRYQLLEYWEDDRYIVVINKKWVIRGPEDNPFDHGRKPFVAMQYNKIPHQFYGVGALEPVADLQKATNITLTQRIEYISNLLNQQFAVLTGREVDEDAIIEGYPIVHVSSSDAVTPLDKGSVPQVDFLTAGEIAGAMERSMGISGYSVGAPSSAQDNTQGTKGGIQAIIGEAQTRFDLTMRRFENVVLRKTAQMFLDLDRQYFPETEEKIVMVSDNQQNIQVPLTKELLQQAEWVIDIVPGSTGIVDKAQKAQSFMAWVEFSMSTIPNFNREMAVLEAAEHQDIENPQRFIIPMDQFAAEQAKKAAQAGAINQLSGSDKQDQPANANPKAAPARGG